MDNCFNLNGNFIKKYSNINPPFGFNGLGEIVYLRTYSRLKEEEGKNEKWFETVKRVVEGTYSIQKNHIEKYNLGWDEDKAQESAQEMYDRIFNMKFLPPGRGLYSMGSSIIKNKGLFASLNNCGYVSTSNIGIEGSKPFIFMMDMSMCGVGVGFDCKGSNKIVIKNPNGKFEHNIPDSREGWVESLKLLLDSYFKGDALPNFNYSLIRKEGDIIKGFGGTSSGYKPLENLHIEINKLLKNKIGNKLTGRDIVDIMNLIGVCVVSGNVRRSAQIVFDSPNEEYLKLKDYNWNKNNNSWEGNSKDRANFGWASNNSVFCDVGMDYSYVSDQTSKNGEPGYFWLENARKYSRMGDYPDNKDYKASGCNPCGEQTLESYELCCLCDIFPTKHKDKEDFCRTIKFAYLYAKTVTLGQSHWVETNRVMLRNRRIGTSISGIAQFIETNSIDKLRDWLQIGYNTIQKYDFIYSDWLSVPKSIKTTSVKPSGTVSLLAGVSPGIHYPEFNYGIRRVRMSKFSDLIPILKNQGYIIEDDITSPNTTCVVEFPIKMENVRTNKEVSMWEKLSLAAFMQEHWADNQVSCTVTFQENEKSQIKHALNYFQYKLKGISFLPYNENNYAQMPYESITKEEYEKRIKQLSNKLKIKEVSEEAVSERFCDGDTCILN